MLDTVSNNLNNIYNLAKNLNYNSNILCTYKMFEHDSDTESESLICYQNQLLQIFNLDCFCDKLQKYIDNCFEILRENIEISNIFTILSNKLANVEFLKLFAANNDNNTKLDNIFIFQLLFSYEYFDVFHKCFSKYLNALMECGEKFDLENKSLKYFKDLEELILRDQS